MSATIKELCAKATPGPWSVPHFAREDCKCNCGYVLCESLFGAVATVHRKKDGTPSSQDDNPPHEQAVANAQLIARLSPQTVLAVVEALEAVRESGMDTIASGRIEAGLDDAVNKVVAALALLNAQPTE